MARTVIIGAGVTGTSCARHLSGADELVVLDTREAPPGGEALAACGVELLTGVSRYDFSGADRVVVSPGVALDICLVRQAQAAGVPVMGDIDLFFEAARAPVLAVTGTNGKSTVVSMAAAMLQAHGLDAVAGGNLGEAALDLLQNDRQAYVVELSSFQLERLGPHERAAAAFLNVSDDHLDRHGDMASYVAAKQHVYDGARVRVWNRDDPRTRPVRTDDAEVVSFSADEPPSEADWGIRGGMFVRGGVPLLPVEVLQLSGTHNQTNFLAACALVHPLGVGTEAMAAVAASFAGLPHRVELVAEIDGVRYINDSKATNVGATMAAVRGVAADLTDGARVVLIAGGEGKGADFSPLTDLESLRHVVLIGRDARLLEAAFSGVPSERASSMAAGVRAARAAARDGDVVLLAPACASFDMFDNFEARGRAFAQAVLELPA